MNFINPIARKKWLALAGLVWFAYIIFHLLSLLNFHAGQAVFDEFFAEFNQTIMYKLMLIILIVALIFHLFTAISRAFSNQKKRKIAYKIAYPQSIPRILPWLAVSILLAFIIFHTVQMKFFETQSLHGLLHDLLTQPLMFGVYLLATLVLSAHLWHALTNVLQTLGYSSKMYFGFVGVLITLIFSGFMSIPLSLIR
jgi:succinate dehydrogenase / fumarate reductase cytochrome b subunit